MNIIANVMIAGPSGSGKSTLAAIVAAEVAATLISIDDYRRRGIRRMVPCNGELVRTFEHPDHWNGLGLALRLKALDRLQQPWIAEGVLLWHFAPIATIPARRFYIDVPFEVCVARRQFRARHPVSDRSFALVGRAETDRWVRPQRDSGAIVLDGTRAAGALAEDIVSSIAVA